MQAQQSQKGNALRCLVVEDSEFDQKMIQRAFSGSGVNADLTFVSTLAKARVALSISSYSLIVMDNKLPDGNGGEYAQELAQDPAYRGVSIVIVSGWPSPFMWAKAKAAGLNIIDKNDDPLPKLQDLFKFKFRKNRLSNSLLSSES